MLGVDVGGPGCAGDLVGVEERALRGGRDRGGVRIDDAPAVREPLLGRGGDGDGVDADPAHCVGGGLLVDHHAEDVQ